MIEIKKLTKKYDRIVLDEINLSFKTNNIYLIKGISGSGKSTLLNILSGLDKDFKGHYSFNKKNIKKMDKNEFNNFRNSIGYITQKSMLISTLNIMDNLLFIKNDLSKITEYAQVLNVDHLLYKMPHNLSGGERQRIAIIRALLLEQKIIIADEPTASLDAKNAKIVVEAFKKLQNSNRGIIISTHNNYFDEIANEVITLDYGKSTNYTKKINKSSSSTNIINNNTFNLKNNFKFVISKFKNSYNILTIVTSILLFLLIFIMVSLSFNLKNQLIKKEADKKHFHVFNVSKDEFNKYKDIYNNVKLYESYIIEEEKFKVYTLLPEEDSSLAIDKVIQFGHFPKNNKEILINQEFAKTLYPNIDFNQVINKYIKIKENEYQITGIITNNNELLNEVYSAGVNYKSEDINKAFMPYEEISMQGKLARNNLQGNIMAFRTFYLYPEVINYISEGLLDSYYINLINDITFSVNLYVKWLYMGISALSIIIVFFIGNQITLSLFYRRKEIGYLQIFGISKSRLKFIIYMQYIFNSLISMIFSIILYFIFIIIGLKMFGIDLLLPIPILLITIITILIYISILIYLPLHNFLRKDILKLIS